MKSKRIKFALFISVFALYGCASGSRSQNEAMMSAANISKLTKTDAVSTAAFHTTGYVSVDAPSQIKSMALTANDPINTTASVIMRARDARGKLKSQSALKKISQSIHQKVKTQLKKEAAEKRKKEARTFTPKTTTYGVDCYGCGGEDGRGGTAVGVALDANRGVKMPDGSWQPGIRYGKYYIIAADPSIPFCSIVKISNHGLSGAGLSPQEPYYAIVLDRGGAIYGSHLDLYVGRENSGLINKVKQTTPKAEIVRMGGKRGNTCSL